MVVSSNPLILEQKQHQEEETHVPTVEEILESFVRMQCNMFDMSILKKFYDTGQDNMLDTTGWCLPILYDLMTKQFELGITRNGFRKRLKKLEKYKFIKKIPRTSPSLYEAIPEIRDVIRRGMILWLVRRGYRSI